MSTPPRLGRIARAFSKMVDAVKADFATSQSFDAKYATRGGPQRASLAGDLVKRVGLQISGAYRVMRFFDEAGIPLAPQVMSRMIRHVYGSDIHWKAEIEPGVVVVHGMGLCISHAARVGRSALLFQHVTLGAGRHPETLESGSPTIEDDVHIGAGTVIIGPVTIGARSKIMANCVITRSVPPDSLVEAPTPSVKARARSRSSRESSGSGRAS